MHQAEKQCLFCGHPLRGRTDKMYCNDMCRNAFHNSRNETNRYVRSVNAIIRKNRRILAACIVTGQRWHVCKVSELLAAGFNFCYHTHACRDVYGNLFRFCYDHGYMEQGREHVLVMRDDSRLSST